jgi:hypothetical protein
MSIKTIGGEYIVITNADSASIAGNVSISDTLYLPDTTIINNNTLIAQLNNKANSSELYLKSETDLLLNSKASINSPIFTGSVSLPSNTNLNSTSLAVQIASKAPINSPVFTGPANFGGNIVSPRFKTHVIANNIGGINGFNSVAWLITNNYVFNGGTCLVSISADGHVPVGGSVGNNTWTLQRSTNNGANYSTIGVMTKWFNLIDFHSHISASFIWLPGSITVTNFRVLFTSQMNSNSRLYLTIVEFPFS